EERAAEGRWNRLVYVATRRETSDGGEDALGGSPRDRGDDRVVALDDDAPQRGPVRGDEVGYEAAGAEGRVGTPVRAVAREPVEEARRMPGVSSRHEPALTIPSHDLDVGGGRDEAVDRRERRVGMPTGVVAPQGAVAVGGASGRRDDERAIGLDEERGRDGEADRLAHLAADPEAFVRCAIGPEA